MQTTELLLFGLVGWVAICPPWPWPPWPWPIIRVVGVVLGLAGGYLFNQTLGTDLVASTIGAYAFTRVVTDLLGVMRPDVSRK